MGTSNETRELKEQAKGYSLVMRTIIAIIISVVGRRIEELMGNGPPSPLLDVREKRTPRQYPVCGPRRA